MDQKTLAKVLCQLDEVAVLTEECRKIFYKQIQQHQEEGMGSGPLIIINNQTLLSLSVYHMSTIIYAFEIAPDLLEKMLMGHDEHKEEKARGLLKLMFFVFFNIFEVSKERLDSELLDWVNPGKTQVG